MTTTLALEHLYQSVREYFTFNQINAVNVFGHREVGRIDEALPRIVWTPGDPGGAVGEVGGARNPGSYPQPVANLAELFTVHIVGHDTRDPESELAQYHVTRQLYDIWLVAVYRANGANFRVRSQAWVKGRTVDRSYGAMLRAVCEVQSPIVDALPDEPLVGALDAGQANAVAVVPTDADLTVSLVTSTDPDDPGEA